MKNIQLLIKGFFSTFYRPSTYYSIFIHFSAEYLLCFYRPSIDQSIFKSIFIKRPIIYVLFLVKYLSADLLSIILQPIHYRSAFLSLIIILIDYILTRDRPIYYPLFDLLSFIFYQLLLGRSFFNYLLISYRPSAVI